MILDKKTSRECIQEYMEYKVCVIDCVSPQITEDFVKCADSKGIEQCDIDGTRLTLPKGLLFLFTSFDSLIFGSQKDYEKKALLEMIAKQEPLTVEDKKQIRQLEGLAGQEDSPTYLSDAAKIVCPNQFNTLLRCARSNNYDYNKCWEESKETILCTSTKMSKFESSEIIRDIELSLVNEEN